MGHMINGESTKELLEAQAHIWNHTLSFINSMSLNCAIQLGIPDIIHNHGNNAITLSQLVSSLNIPSNKADSIQRLMRVLVHSGFFTQQQEEHQECTYFLTPSSKLLLKDSPLRATPVVSLILDPTISSPFNFLATWFQNDDDTVFETAHGGRKFWDCIANEPQLNHTFYDAMINDSLITASVLIKECKDVFKGLKSLVDVGGGTGTMAEAIAAAFPEMKCTVFDLPHVVGNLKGGNNLEFVGGDMFEAIPPANAVLMKWIMHDWGDEECLKILKKCKEAIPSKDEGGKVIIIDMTIDYQKENNKDVVEAQVCFDMVMMAMFRSKERNVKEWKKLFLESGFSHYKISPILGVRSLIELYP